MLAALVLAALAGGPGLVLEVTEDPRLAAGGDERVVGVALTRTCGAGDHVLLPGSGSIQVRSEGQGIAHRPATMALPLQVCSAAPSITAYTELWLNASSGMRPGTLNATAVLEGAIHASDPFTITVQDAQAAPQTGGIQPEMPGRPHGLAVSPMLRRVASLVATAGFTLGLLRGPRAPGHGGRKPLTLAVVRVSPAAVRASPVVVRAFPVAVRGSAVAVRGAPVAVRASPVAVRASPVPVRGSPVA